MGNLQCIKVPRKTKNHQTNITKLVTQQSFNKFEQSTLINGLTNAKTSIMLKIYQKRIATFNGVDSINYMPLLEKYIMGQQNNFKFVFQKGVSDMLFGEKMADNMIGFLLQRTVNGNLYLQVKIKQGQLLWKKISNQFVQLMTNDHIMIGKYQLKLAYWGRGSQGGINQKSKSSVYLKQSKDGIAQCRICLQQGYTGNPLLKSCKCIGSLKRIHQRCLSKWIFNNPVSFEQNMCFYKVNVIRSQCQICHGSFKDYIWNRIMAIISTFEGNYAIFQLLNQKQKIPIQLSQQFIIFKMDDHKNCIKIGNTKGNNFFVPSFSQNTVSTSLIMKDNHLYLKDTNSAIGPYIQTQSMNLSYDREYKIGLFYLKITRN